MIDLHPVEQTAYPRDIKDNGYRSFFTNSWLVRQRNRSCIKGLGKNPQKSELIHWWQCLLSGATEPCPLGLRETLACIHVIPHNVTATCGIHVILHMSRPRVACWHGSRQNSQKTECVLRHLPIGGWKVNCSFKRYQMQITEIIMIYFTIVNKSLFYYCIMEHTSVILLKLCWFFSSLILKRYVQSPIPR